MANERSSLYRKEALAYQRERAWGELLVVTPRPARALVWLTIVLTIPFVIFLSTAEYTRKARAAAVLAYADAPIIVAATDAGAVSTIWVNVGDNISSGQRLATISTERMTQGEAVFAASARDAEIKHTALKMERQQINTLRMAQQSQTTARIYAMTKESAQITREIAAQNERVTQLKKQVDRLRTLAAEHFVSDFHVQQKQDEVAAQIVTLETLKRNQVTLEREITSVRGELPTLLANVEARLAALTRDEAVLAQTTREGLARQSYDVIATCSGVIQRIIATQGQTIGTGGPLLQIQTGSPGLLADIYVPTRSAGFLNTGQRVRLAIDAFPLERFGHITATISSISRSVLSPGDIGLPSLIHEPVFRVRAQLDNESIFAYGNSYPLRSGLTAQADIALDSRPLYLWIIEPILRLKGRL